jgi:hypothetical protein
VVCRRPHHQRPLFIVTYLLYTAMLPSAPRWMLELRPVGGHACELSEISFYRSPGWSPDRLNVDVTMGKCGVVFTTSCFLYKLLYQSLLWKASKHPSADFGQLAGITIILGVSH